MRAALLLIAVAASSVVLAASDHTILFDEDVNFASFKTYRMAAGRVTTKRPELGGASFAQGLGDTIIATLTKQGFREARGSADLVADYQVTTIDWSIGSFGRANVNDGRGRRGGPAAPVDFTDATLVIDLKRSDSDALVWRGVFNETDKDAARLAQLLMRDAVSLLGEFPPKKK